jgi:hypothetical protein
MAQAAPDGLKGLRGRAVLLVGFAGAFRRSELVALKDRVVPFFEEHGMISRSPLHSVLGVYGHATDSLYLNNDLIPIVDVANPWRGPPWSTCHRG